jgi:hypothetical protein
MQRYIITERRGTDGLRLEKDAEVPQLQGPNDVSAGFKGLNILAELVDPNQYQSSFPKRKGYSDFER